MRKFGGFETVQELFRGGLGSVFTARREGASGAPAFAVKTCEPVAEIVGEAQAKASVAQFLGAARVQQAAAAAGGGGGESHWAPVHEVGETPYGAYYVTDLFERGSLERLSLGMVRVDGRALHRLIGGVAAGLAELRGACGGRPHGNLRPSNILVAFTGGLETARVALTDPLADGAVEPARDGMEDLRAVGRALYLAVFHQPLRDGAVLPLPPAEQWAALGKAGDGWRELCSRLLAPEGCVPPLTLDTAIAEVAALGAVKGGAGKKKLAIAVGVGVMVVGGAGILMMSRSAPAPAEGEGGAPVVEVDAEFDLERWEYVCRACWEWFLEFERDVGQPGQRDALAQDPDVKRVIEGIEAARRAGSELNPSRFPGISGQSLKALFDLEGAPDEARASGAVRATVTAERVIRGVEEGLSAEKWGALGELRRAAAAFGERGWGGAQGVVSDLVAKAEPGKTSLSIAAKQVIDAAPIVRSIQGDWAKIEGAGPELDATGDAVLAKFMAWARAHAAGAEGSGEAVLADLQRRVAEAAGVGTRLREFARAGGDWETIDSEEFWAKSEVHRALGAGREADAALFQDWLFQVTSYRALSRESDPRRAWEGVPAEVKEARAIADSIGAYLTSKGRTPEAEDAARAEELERLTKRVGELVALRWSVTNRSVIETEAPRIVREAAELKVKLDRRLTDMRTDDIQGFADAQARLKERQSVTSSGALNEVWRAQRDALIAELAAAPGGGDTATLRRRAKSLEDAIVALDAAVPRAEMPAELAGGAWTGALGTAAEQQRERVIGAAVAGLAPGAGVETLSSAAAESYREERGRLVALAEDAAALEQLLDLGYGLTETAPSGRGVGETLERLETGVAGAPEALRTAMGPLLSRASELRAIAASTDRGRLAQLVQGARADVPEQAISAWRRLGEISWPRGVGELEQERTLREALGRVVGAMRDGGRKGTLEGELRAEALTRFQRGAAGAAGAADMESAIGQLGGFGLTVGDLTDEGLKFNTLLLGLRRELAREGIEEARAQELVGAFVAQARGEAAEALRANEGARGVVEQLAGALSSAGQPRERAAVDFTKIGPGAMGEGWAIEVVRDGEEVVYRREVPRAVRGAQQLELRFVRVATGDGTGAYVLANELSLGQFIAIAEAAEKWSEMAELLRPEDDRGTPTVWAGDDRGLRNAPYWTANHPQVSQLRPMYPASLRPSELPDGASTASNPRYNLIDAAQGQPSFEMPMQQVPVAAAMFSARLAGCRLPTDVEWRAAVEMAGGVGEPGAWNLRDATWAKQQAHVKAVKDEMIRSNTSGAQRFQWPDQGSFALAIGRTDIPTEAQAKAYPTDDGRLWFAPAVAAEGRQFHHLIGNVAELVFDDPAALEALEADDPGAFDTFASRNAAKVGVIGGSSLSPPNVELGTVHRPDRDQSSNGFADVGIRLAFSADAAMGPERFSVIALRAAGAEGYVLAR